MRNKIKQIYKGFSTVDLIPFLRGQGTHFKSTLEHFWLLAGLANGPMR